MTTAGLACWGEQVGLQLGFTLCTDFYAKNEKWALKATIHSPAFSAVAHNSRVALSIQDINKMKSSGSQVVVYWELFFLPWKLFDTVMPITLQWTKSTALPTEIIIQSSIPPWILMTLTCLDQCRSLKWLEFTWKWVKSLEKSWSLKGTIYIYFLHFNFNLSVLTFFSEDSDDDDSDDDKVSLSQAVYISWSHCSDQLEHEYAIAACALSLVPAIRYGILERLTCDMWE